MQPSDVSASEGSCSALGSDGKSTSYPAQTTTGIVTTVLLVLAAVLCIVHMVKLVYQRFKLSYHMAKLPGPLALPVVGTTYLLLKYPLNGLLKLAAEYQAQYSPLFCTWTGPYPEVHITEAEHFEVILNSAKHFQKSYAYQFFHPWLGTGLLTSEGTKWRSHRKLITPAFHFSILDNFVEVFDEKSKILVEKLQAKANGKSFDIFPYITRCALDIVCDTAMGTEVHAQEENDSEYVKAVYDVCKLTLKRILSPWLHPNFIYKYTKTGRQYKECINILHGFTENVLIKRRNALLGVTTISQDGFEHTEITGTKKRKAFLDLLLEASQDNGILTDETIREEVDTFMFEGHDTTAVSMSWTLYMLGHHPEIQEKVYTEQKDIFQGSNRAPSMKDLQQMKYLEQVIRESLRLYPSIPFIQRNLSEDVFLDGFYIPAGCTLTLHIYLAHRNPKHFPNPEKFDPDNFLPERIHSRHPFAFIPFSGGARNCIGQRYALLEEKCVLSSVIRKFAVHSLQDQEACANIVLKPVTGVNVSLTLRE